MRYHKLIEAPITDISFHGDMEHPGTFRQDDLKKFADPIWKERVMKLFQRAPVDIELHIVNGTPERKIELRSKYTIDRVSIDNPASYVGIQSIQWAEHVLGHPVDATGKIVCLLFNNEGSNRVGMTPWIVGHRIGHCFFERNSRPANENNYNMQSSIGDRLAGVINLVERYHKSIGKHMSGVSSEERIIDVARLISPFRSARTGSVRDSGEYVVELLVQFLSTGAITFNTDWIEGEAAKPADVTPLERAILGALDRERSSIYNVSREGYRFNELWDALKSNPLRPRTRAALLKVTADMAERDLYAIIMPTGKHENMHKEMQDAARELSNLYAKLLQYNTGRVLVL